MKNWLIAVAVLVIVGVGATAAVVEKSRIEKQTAKRAHFEELVKTAKQAEKAWLANNPMKDYAAWEESGDRSKFATKNCVVEGIEKGSTLADVDRCGGWYKKHEDFERITLVYDAFPYNDGYTVVLDAKTKTVIDVQH